MRRFALILAFAAALTLRAADPMATLYTSQQCEGSLTPYPTQIEHVNYPDTLRPVFINHVGRHGSRYPASSAHCLKLRKALSTADSLSTITSTGKDLLRLTDYVIDLSTNRWGALDSLGMAEQRAIATRMFYSYAEIFNGGATVQAISSYSPRSMMSMYSFTHQLDRMDNHINFVTGTGRKYSKLMRPFDTDTDYRNYLSEGPWRKAYQEYFESNCPTSAIDRALGKDYPYADADEQRDLAITEYYVLAGMAAMSVEVDALHYFTKEEYNALWSCFNLRQYLQRTATTLSSVPADIASDLLLDLINTTDNFIDGKDNTHAWLRFGHAETLMPLVSLMRLPGCYYLTNYFDTVGLHWRDWQVVPMAANLQMILFVNPKTGQYYVRTELNEVPVALIPNTTDIYVEWSRARQFLMRCVPLYAQ